MQCYHRTSLANVFHTHVIHAHRRQLQQGVHKCCRVDRQGVQDTGAAGQGQHAAHRRCALHGAQMSIVGSKYQFQTHPGYLGEESGVLQEQQGKGSTQLIGGAPYTSVHQSIAPGQCMAHSSTTAAALAAAAMPCCVFVSHHCAHRSNHFRHVRRWTPTMLSRCTPSSRRNRRAQIRLFFALDRIIKHLSADVHSRTFWAGAAEEPSTRCA